MNAFRLVFLASVLGASVLFAFARLTPGVWEDQLERTLELRAEAEVRTVLAAERFAAAEREAVATHIAADHSLITALDPSATDAPAIAPTFARVRDAHLRDDNSWAVLFDARGEPLAPAAFRGVVTPRDFGALADVPRALESGEVQTRYSVSMGRVFGLVAVPVRSDGSRPIGAVVLAHEFTGRLAAERRSVGALDLAFFANNDVVAATTSNEVVLEELASLVTVTNNDNVGTRHGVRGHSQLHYTAVVEGLDGEAIEAHERMAVLVPVRFDGAMDPLVGAVVIVDAPSPPGSLAGILIEGRAFDDGTIVIWVFVMGGLLLFFVGLLVHDFAQGRAIQQLADRIADRITMNEPTQIEKDNSARYLRPIADAFNRFVEAYRQTTHLARNAQAEASVASQEVGALQHQLQELREGSGEIRIPVSTRRVTRPTGKTPAITGPDRTAPTAPPVEDSDDDLLDPDAFADDPSAVDHATVAPKPPTPNERPTAKTEAPEARPTRRTAAITGADRIVPASASISQGPGARKPTPPPLPVAKDDDEPTFSLDDGGRDDDAPTFEAADDDPVFDTADDAPTFEATDDAPATFDLADAPSAPTESDEANTADESAALFDLADAPSAAAPSAEAPEAAPATPGDGADNPFDALDALAGGPTPEAAPEPAPEPVDEPEPTAEAAPEPEPEPVPATPTTPDDTHDDLFASDGAALDAGSSSSDADGALDYDNSSAFDDVMPNMDASNLPTAEAGAKRPEADTVIPGTVGDAAAPAPAPAAPAATEDPSWAAEAGEQLASMLDDDAPAASEPEAPEQPSAVPAPPEPSTTESSSEDLLAAAEERLARIRATRSSAPFIGDDAPADDAPAEDPEMRALFDQFVEARRSLGDDVSRFTYEGFAARIEKNRAKLMKQYDCSDVKFRVEVGGGKATLKATPVR